MRKKNPAYIAAIESYVEHFTASNGRPPTVREIAAGTGMSKTNAQDYISYMRGEGLLERDGTARSITGRRERQETLLVPVLGAVSCGVPRFAEENIEGYIRLPLALLGGGEFYFLHASGDSMIGAGIDDGDLVLIRQQSYAEAGQIVVALMDEEATLKRFYPQPEQHCVRLHPENPALEDITVGSCEIQGVAVKVLKDLE